MVAEADLRAALRPYQVAAADFEAGIRQRIQAGEAASVNDPLADAPSWLRVAAAILPLPIMTGGKIAGSVLPLANASGISKLLGWVALPAFSLFVLPGAAIFGAAGIRRIQADNVPESKDLLATQEATRLWWQQNKWLASFFYATTLALAWLGATSLMLLVYLISLGVMLYVLSGLVKRGLGNRRLIGGSCVTGLSFLGQVSGFCTIGQRDIHFVDQTLLSAIFFGGMLLLIPLIGSYETIRVPVGGTQRRWLWVLVFAQWLMALLAWSWQPTLLLAAILFGAAVLISAIVSTTIKYGSPLPINQRGRILVLLLVVVPTIAWFTNPIWRPTTPARIKTYVESFDKAPFSSSSWSHWEIVATWAIDSGLDPDLSQPRQLLAMEISGEKNPFVLGSAFRTGLVRLDQIDQLSGQLAGYDAQRRILLDGPQAIVETQPITSLEQYDWVIRASILRDDLTPAECDLLQKRLLVNLEQLWKSPYRQVAEALRVTQLLRVIGRPIDPNRYRQQVHGLLRELHTTDCGFFLDSGGFQPYLSSLAGDMQATACAVELMQIYGVPDGIDVNWVRSFLRPKFLRFGDDVYIAAAALARLNHLPGVSQPTWLDYVYYERSLIMAVLLVALCLYATLSSPAPRSL
jgi:hypothetical protein